MNTSIGKKQKVLIVDDDMVTRMLIRASIGQWGFSSVEANNGEAAFSILQEKDPPLIIISDWMMPKEDGISFFERVKTQLKINPYTILVTHNTGIANQIKAIEAGANAFLTKPINYEELQCQLLIGMRILSYTCNDVNLDESYKKILADFDTVRQSKNRLVHSYDLLKNTLSESNRSVFQDFSICKDQLINALITLEESIKKLDKGKNNEK